MTLEKPTVFERWRKALEVNPQRKFSSYAAELSFYIIWAIIPLLLTFSNVIAILPFSSAEILTVIEQVLPEEVGEFLMPILSSYITRTSASVFSVGLIISLWPASNVFNTIQRVLNTIFKAEPRQNILITRLFSYISTLALVLIIFVMGVIFIFGESVLQYISQYFDFDIPIVSSFLQQGGLIGMGAIFILMFSLYHFMPNVRWSPKYASAGALFATVGFALISQLFTLYLSFNKNIDSNSTIGIFIVVLIWLYYNMIVISLGAYVAVVFHDFVERDYLEMVAMTKTVQTFEAQSEDFRQHIS